MSILYAFLQAQDVENIILVDYRTVPVPVESLDPTKIYYYTRYFRSEERRVGKEFRSRGL